MGSGASKRISCPVCSTDGLTNREFVEHYRTCHNKQCTKCGLSGFETDDDMHKHYDEVHNSKPGSISCRKCTQKFTEENDYIKHIKSSHDFSLSTVSVREGGEPACQQCGKVKKNEEKLAKHMRKNHFFECDGCKQTFESLKKLQEHTKDEHPLVFKCPMTCDKQFSKVDVFIQHLSDAHNFAFVVNTQGEPGVTQVTCPDCSINVNLDMITEHMKNIHINDDPDEAPKTVAIKCPNCEDAEEEFVTVVELLDHMRSTHNFSSAVNMGGRNGGGNMNLPQQGDKILAMWEVSRWQYFHASIRQKIPGELKYEIDWDDGDTTGRYVDYFNIAVDRVPTKEEIGIGSIILFPQGGYTAGSTQLTGGLRWHQGRITDVYKNSEGCTLYKGIHTKGREDGKMMNYRGFSQEFVDFKLEDFRVGPNVFDLLDDNGEEEDDSGIDINDVDVYFSCCYEGKKDKKSCAPEEIASDLTTNGINLVKSRGLEKNDQANQLNLMKNANVLMKKAKVFVACISDDYVQNENCRMEFQFAKSTLKKPVIPLVFGGKKWQLSVVGMLISGELYIDLKDKSVKDNKMESIIQSISTHLESDITDNGQKPHKSSEEADKADIFLSYCWSNSNHALKNNHIDNLLGNELADPREIKRELSDAGYNTWLDIDRLKSGDQGVGMFEQLAAALKNSKIVLACISDEYANSANCRMEFQFACKTLEKPILPLVVGTGTNWENTIVGMLIRMNSQIEPINLQNLQAESDFKTSMSTISEKVKNLVAVADSSQIKAKQTRKSRKPKIGDHVISHHCLHNYYTATIVNYDASTMKYTVEWDDGDTTGRVQNYNQVALNEVPEAEDVGVDSVVFFPQGYYRFEGQTCLRYHEGVVTKLHGGNGGQVLVDGHHTKGTEEGKTIAYRDYCYEFYNIPLKDVRIAPSALDTME